MHFRKMHFRKFACAGPRRARQPPGLAAELKAGPDAEPAVAEPDTRVGKRVAGGRVAGGFESTARRKLEDALVASLEAGDAPADACAAALAAADLS